MAANILKTSNGSGVVNRGLRVGLEQAATSETIPQIEVQLTVGQEKMVMDLANLLGLSVRALLNAPVLRYALHDAKRQRIKPSELKEFPKRLSGRVVLLELTIKKRLPRWGKSLPLPICRVVPWLASNCCTNEFSSYYPGN